MVLTIGSWLIFIWGCADHPHLASLHPAAEGARMDC